MDQCNYVCRVSMVSAFVSAAIRMHPLRMHTQCIAYADRLRILLVRTQVSSSPCPCNREMANMPRGPKVTRESIEEMVEMVRENTRLYDPTCADYMDATMSNDNWHNISPCPLTCSMFPALISETLCPTRRPIYSHHSDVGSVHIDVQTLYTRPGLWVVFTDAWSHFTDTDERRHRFIHCVDTVAFRLE